MNRLRSTLAFLILAAPASAFAADAPPKDYSHARIVTQMMAFDANHDGKLTRDELTDHRLDRLFNEADADHKGYVTQADLEKLAAKLDADMPATRGGQGGGPGGFDRGGFGPDDGGPDGFGGPDDFGPPGGAHRGPRGPMGPGQVIPPPVADALNLTADQKAQLADLQKDVDAKLAKILTPQQMEQLKRGPRMGPPPDQR